jgi:hypothetical protein
MIVVVDDDDFRDNKGAPPRAENAPQEVGWKRAEIVCGSAGHNPHTRRTAALSLPIVPSI